MQLLIHRRVQPALRPFIDHIVFHCGIVTGHTKERVLPDGGIDLIIDLGDKAQHVYDNGDFSQKTAYRKAWISGMRDERLTIDAGSGSPMIVVRFRPGGARCFFDFPMIELNNHVIALDDLLGARIERLREQLLEARSPLLYFDILEAFFLQLGRTRMVVNPFIEHAVNLINSRMVPPTVRYLAGRLGYSHKHLISIFEQHIGIRPKRFARVMRFQKAVHLMERGAPRSWASMAQAFGFYDQAHFINEFRAFSGLTPGRYLQAKGDYINFVPVD